MKHESASASESWQPRESAVLPRLSLMMFLQYAIWGAWLPILLPYLLHLGFSGEQIGNMFAAGAAGAIVAPFVAGQIADRWFATEKFLAILHLAGAVLMWQLANVREYESFLLFSLVYSLLYAPTMPLTNSLAFHHLPDTKLFGKVRLWGTLGWIVVGIAVGQWLLHAHTPADAARDVVTAAQDAGRADAFRLSAILGALMGAYCLTLPHTPPQRGSSSVAIFEAFGAARKNPLLTLFLLAIPVACIHQFYFVHTAGFLSAFQGGEDSSSLDAIFGVGGGGIMTIGQMSEIGMLALVPVLARRWSRKSIFALGALAYALRMALFAYVHDLGLPPMLLLVAGVALHGVCFGCFIFFTFIVIDEEAPRDVRASAQSLYNLIIVGIGIIVGSMVSTWLSGWARGGKPAFHYDDPEQTRALFSVPMWASLAVLVLLLVFYPGGRSSPSSVHERTT